MLHPVLSPCAKHSLCPGNIADIRGNETLETGILFCSHEDTRPPDVRLSTAHLPPTSFPTLGTRLTSLDPTQLIMDVDSMPLCLAFYPITGGFFVFTPWIKCSFVQGIWCIWNFMYCENILCSSRLVILRLFFLCAPLCTAKQRNTQKLSLKVSNGYKPSLVRSYSGKRPSPTCNGWLSKITLIWTEI